MCESRNYIAESDGTKYMIRVPELIHPPAIFDSFAVFRLVYKQNLNVTRIMICARSVHDNVQELPQLSSRRINTLMICELARV